MELEEGARRVARTLREAGHEAYFAGGCVRDLLLQRAPKDFDVATDARPEQIEKLFRRTLMIGAAFGVVQVRLGGHGYEVATYRRDAEYTDGRRPETVHYSTSKEEDVERRDFTINALLMDPETREVIDLVGGKADLVARQVRAVGDPEARFAEDRLRMLRAVRFATRFDFDIEPKTAEAIRRHARNLGAVSRERVLHELEQIFTSDHPGPGLLRLEALGLAQPALPFLPDDAVERRARYEAVDRARLPERRADLRTKLALALLLGPSSTRDAEAALRALKTSRKLIQSVNELLQIRELLERPDAHREADWVRLAGDVDADRTDAFARGSGCDEAADRLAGIRRDVASDPLPERPVLSGRDLAREGLPPGPEFKSLLRAVDDLVLERRLRTADEARAWVRTHREKSV